VLVWVQLVALSGVLRVPASPWSGWFRDFRCRGQGPGRCSQQADSSLWLLSKPNISACAAAEPDVELVSHSFMRPCPNPSTPLWLRGSHHGRKATSSGPRGCQGGVTGVPAGGDRGSPAASEGTCGGSSSPAWPKHWGGGSCPPQLPVPCLLHGLVSDLSQPRSSRRCTSRGSCTLSSFPTP